MSVIFGTSDELKKWRPILEQEYKSAYEQAKKDFDLQIKRADYAAMAMQALLSTMTIERDQHTKYISTTAVEYADALLLELSKERE